MEFGHVGANQFILPWVLQGAFDGDAEAAPHRDQLITSRREPISPNVRGFQMRKLIMIAALILASTAASAGPSRSLSMASADATQPVTEQPKTQTAEPSKTVERPKLAAPQETAKDSGDKPAPKRRHPSTEARIIYELHRHGIYW
jgi:hypothetical protein